MPNPSTLAAEDELRGIPRRMEKIQVWAQALRDYYYANEAYLTARAQLKDAESEPRQREAREAMARAAQARDEARIRYLKG